MVFIYEGFRLVLQISMASTKRIHTNSNYTAWNCNAYKRITIFENPIPNPCYTIWNVDVFKRKIIDQSIDEDIIVQGAAGKTNLAIHVVNLYAIGVIYM